MSYLHILSDGMIKLQRPNCLRVEPGQSRLNIQLAVTELFESPSRADGMSNLQ